MELLMTLAVGSDVLIQDKNLIYIITKVGGCFCGSRATVARTVFMPFDSRLA
jgi:hypothetical protein